MFRDSVKRHTMAFAVMVSLALHGLLALPYLLFRYSEKSQPRSRLQVELYGMIADRQMEAKTLAATMPPTPMPAPSPPQKKLEPVKQPAKLPIQREIANKLLAIDSPVLVSESEKQITTESAPRDHMANLSSADKSQVQRMQDQKDKIDAEKLYGAKLTKKIQSNLIYPNEIKKKGYEGISVVRFVVMEDGTIQPGTIRIEKSSGNTVLDTSALTATQVSAPFDRRPDAAEMIVKLGFTLNN